MPFDFHKEYEHRIPTLVVVFTGTALLVLPDAAEQRGKWVSSFACFEFEPFCMQYTSPYLSLEYVNAPRVFLEYESKKRKWVTDHICE